MATIKISLVLLLCFTLGCATLHRHPVVTKVIVIGAAAAVGGGIALATRKSCRSSYNGVAYQGTPPCPTWCEPGGECYWK